PTASAYPTLFRSVLERILDGVREGVHRIDAPGVAGIVVMRVPDAVDGRIAQVHVGRGHVDLRAQHMRAIRKFAGLHAGEEIEVLGDAARAVWTVATGFGEAAPVQAHLLEVLAV